MVWVAQMQLAHVRECCHGAPRPKAYNGRATTNGEKSIKLVLSAECHRPVDRCVCGFDAHVTEHLMLDAVFVERLNRDLDRFQVSYLKKGQQSPGVVEG